MNFDYRRFLKKSYIIAIGIVIAYGFIVIKLSQAASSIPIIPEGSINV